MKTWKGITASALALVLILTATVGAAELEALRYASFSGKVVNIEQREGRPETLVSVENADGELVNFVVADDALVISEDGIEGKEVTGFYNGSLPVIMIYPPQYVAEAMVENGLTAGVKYSEFDENYLSKDGELKLNISEETEVVTKLGTPYEGDFRGKAVLVLYDITTRSLPPQTSPELVVVMEDEAESTSEATGQAEATQDEAAVMGELLKAVAALGDDAVMIKLRPALQMLGLEPEWSAAEGAISVNGAVITIGSTTADVNGVTMTMSAAPQIINGSAYVPLDYFSAVVTQSFTP